MTNPKRTESPLPVTLAAMLLARITLNIAYRITYPFLPVIARGLGVNLTSAGLLATVRAAGDFAALQRAGLEQIAHHCPGENGVGRRRRADK
jgi:predicted MFS family arabinose efflux permease